jgi:outer membrane protein TolC
LGINEAIEIALAYSPNLAGVLEDLETALAKRKEAGTYFLPTLSIDYNYFKVKDLTRIRTRYGDLHTGSLNTYQWATSLSQPIFTGFSLSSNYNLAELGVNYNELQVELARLDVAYSTKKAFFGYLKALKGLEVADQQVLQLTGHLKTARDFFDVGILPLNDVLKVEVELAEAQQQQVRAANALSLAGANLNTLLGRPLDPPLVLEDLLKHHEVNVKFEQARQVAKVERPELKALEIQLQQAKWSVHQAQSGYYPQLNLQGSYIFTGENWDFGDSSIYDPTNWQVVTSINWPFWEWGRTMQQVNQKRAGLRKQENIHRDVQDQIELQVKQTWVSFKDAEKNIATALTAIASAEENFRITQERFKEHLTTNTEVLDAQTLLTNALDNYYTALTQFNVAEAGLLRAMGLGLPEGQAWKTAAAR